MSSSKSGPGQRVCADFHPLPIRGKCIKACPSVQSLRDSRQTKIQRRLHLRRGSHVASRLSRASYRITVLLPERLWAFSPSAAAPLTKPLSPAIRSGFPEDIAEYGVFCRFVQMAVVCPTPPPNAKNPDPMSWTGVPGEKGPLPRETPECRAVLASSRWAANVGPAVPERRDGALPSAPGQCGPCQAGVNLPGKARVRQPQTWTRW